MNNEKYEINSNVTLETLKNFIDYIFDNNKKPNAHADGIRQYIDLSDEVKIEFLANKDEKLFRKVIIEDLSTLSCSKERKIKSEEYFATQLDVFLQECPCEMSKMLINSLYNIFFFMKIGNF